MAATLAEGVRHLAAVLVSCAHRGRSSCDAHICLLSRLAVELMDITYIRKLKLYSRLRFCKPFQFQYAARSSLTATKLFEDMARQMNSLF